MPRRVQVLFSRANKNTTKHANDKGDGLKVVKVCRAIVFGISATAEGVDATGSSDTSYGL